MPNALGNILIASVISTPAALAVAALMVPFDRPEPAEALLHRGQANRADRCVGQRHHGRRADSGGDPRHFAGDGGDGDAGEHMLALLPDWNGAPITLQRLFALPFRPVMWLIGVPWAETQAAAT